MYVWSYIICTRKYFNFTEDDMDTARKWVFDSILEAADKQIDSSNMQKIERTPIRTYTADIKKLQVLRTSPKEKYSTLKYCALLQHLISYDSQ